VLAIGKQNNIKQLNKELKMLVYFKREKEIGDEIFIDEFIVNTEKVILIRSIDLISINQGSIKYREGCTLYLSGLDSGIDVDGTIEEVMEDLVG